MLRIRLALFLSKFEVQFMLGAVQNTWYYNESL
jgi:hypothetical protein